MVSSETVFLNVAINGYCSVVVRSDDDSMSRASIPLLLPSFFLLILVFPRNSFFLGGGVRFFFVDARIIIHCVWTVGALCLLCHTKLFIESC